MRISDLGKETSVTEYLERLSAERQKMRVNEVREWVRGKRYLGKQ